MGEKSPQFIFNFLNPESIETKNFYLIWKQKSIVYWQHILKVWFFFSVLSFKGQHGDQGSPGPVGPAGPRVGKAKKQLISEMGSGWKTLQDFAHSLGVFLL